MGPLDLLQSRGTEAIGRYYGTYRAIVLNNEDGINQGKVLVQIPFIQSGIQVWAYPKSIGGGLGYGFKYLMPPKGEFVWVEFEYGDPARPVWSYHPWALGEMPDELKSPNVIGLVTPRGHYVTLNEAAEEDEDILTFQLENGLSVKAGLEKLSVQIPDGSTIEVTKDKIILNGGENKGLINISDLVDKLNTLEEDLNNLKTVFSSWVPVASDGGMALKTALTVPPGTAWATKRLTKTKESDLEDTKVTH